MPRHFASIRVQSLGEGENVLDRHGSVEKGVSIAEVSLEFERGEGSGLEIHHWKGKKKKFLRHRKRARRRRNRNRRSSSEEKGGRIEGSLVEPQTTTEEGKRALYTNGHRHTDRGSSQMSSAVSGERAF